MEDKEADGGKDPFTASKEKKNLLKEK